MAKSLSAVNFRTRSQSMRSRTARRRAAPPLGVLGTAPTLGKLAPASSTSPLLGLITRVSVVLEDVTRDLLPAMHTAADARDCGIWVFRCLQRAVMDRTRDTESDDEGTPANEERHHHGYRYKQ